MLQKKKNLRLIRALTPPPATTPSQDIRSVAGGLLVQDEDAASWKIRRESGDQTRSRRRQRLAAMLFGWRVVKHVKSNAIVYAAADRTLGIGAGQMSRVDASRIAIWKAKRRAFRFGKRGGECDAFLSVSRRALAAADAGAPVRSTGRIRSRQRSHRGRERTRHGDDLYRRTAFPTLRLTCRSARSSLTWSWTAIPTTTTGPAELSCQWAARE